MSSYATGSVEHAYGLTYDLTPAEVNSHTQNGQEKSIIDNPYELARLGIKFIRVQWADLTNLVRCRLIPVNYMSKLLASPRPGITITKVVLGAVELTIVPGFSSAGEYIYAIDRSSFRLCPYAPGHASVMGFFQEKTPRPRYGLTYPLCPRTLLARVVDDAKREAGIEFIVGVEVEFILLKNWSFETGETTAANEGGFHLSSQFPTGGSETVITEEIVLTLMDAGIEVQTLHSEGAPGQYEISTSPFDPLQAMDALVATRETVRNVAAKHGYRATFAPRIHPHSCGNGAHMHISVHNNRPAPKSNRTDQSLAPTLTSTERSFLQGIISHLPGLCALTLPTNASYARMADGVWTGGTSVIWGSDNREAPVRLCGSPRAQRMDTALTSGHHFEVRCVDGTACPHVALAAVLGIGALAVKHNLPLTAKDCPKPVYEMSDDEKRQYKVTDDQLKKLPQSIEDARTALRADKDLEGVLGEFFVEKFLAVNQTLQAAMTSENKEVDIGKLIMFY